MIGLVGTSNIVMTIVGVHSTLVRRATVVISPDHGFMSITVLVIMTSLVWVHLLVIGRIAVIWVAGTDMT